MSKEKLSRSGFHDFNVHRGDRVDLWHSFGLDLWNLSIETPDGGKLRMYNLTEEHLADLALKIAEALGRPAEINRKHLEQCHELLGRMLGKPGVAHTESEQP